MFLVLQLFGTGNLKVEISDLIKKDSVIQIGYPPMRVDFMKSIEGLDFEKAYVNKKKRLYFRIKKSTIYFRFGPLKEQKEHRKT